MIAAVGILAPAQMDARGPLGDSSDMTPESTPLDPESSIALVLRAQAGDAAALERLFERYEKRLKIWAHGRLPQWARGPEDTHDLVQETLCQVVRKLDSFHPRHEGAFLAYVRQVLRNGVTDRIRRFRRRGAVTPLDSAHPSDLPSPDEQAEAELLLDRYEAALERIRPEYREAIVVRIELGLSWAEAAQALGKPSVPAAQMAVRRALVRLAEEMAYERRS